MTEKIINSIMQDIDNQIADLSHEDALEVVKELASQLSDRRDAMEEEANG